ncbi:acyl-CoA N-acyltransferase [Linnemannia elongata]|nr:acyl-CoA N-acyltransferase [Linnemannia elongata]
MPTVDCNEPLSTSTAATTTTTTMPTCSEQRSQDSSIRCTGPYEVSSSLWLSPVALSDTAEVYRILNIDNSIHNGLHSAKMCFPFSEEAARYFTARHLRNREEKGICHEWAIRTGVDGPMIGLFALGPFDHGDMGPCYRGKEPVAKAEPAHETDDGKDNEGILNCGGIGYWLSPEQAGKGVMTEVIKFALTRMAKQELGFDRVHGEAWTDNVGSRRVMERAGMRPAVGVPVFVPKFDAVKDIAHYIYDTE